MSLSAVVPLNQPLPLHITLSSLAAGQLMGQDKMVRTLTAQCHDPTSRVSHLCNNLAIIFAAAGLLDLPSERYIHRVQLKTAGLTLPGVSLIRTDFIKSTEYVPFPKHPGKLQEEKRLVFDCQELIRTFRDFVFANNIRLDRLSICPLGFQRLIRRAGSEAQLPETFIVSLL